jgi:Putative zinc-finger
LSCDPERVTGFVDGELDATEAATVSAHLETCAMCRAQAEAERELRARLGDLPAPRLPAGFAARVRAAPLLRPPPYPALRFALPLAAVLLAGVWLRGYAPFVAWDLSRDHDKCFSHMPPPAKVVSDEPGVVAAWFERQGTRLPALPARVGGLTLVGARYCPLVSLSSAPHVYYASARSHVSVFLVTHGVRLDERLATHARGDSVRLLRVEGELVGIVGEREADVAAFETTLRPVLAAWLTGSR